MEPVGKPKFLTGQTAAQCLQKAPILRGWDNSNQPQDWMTVGCGRKLEAVDRSAHEITNNSEDKDEEWAKWEELLSYELVEFLRKTKFIRYQCPSCDCII
jgi:hypothetical protein